MSSRSSTGFSLVEVVVAVGIFAVSIVAVIGLLAPTSKNVAAVRDTDDASRVISALQGKLQDMASTSTAEFTRLNGFLQATVPADPTDGSPYGNATTTLYASRDGARMGPATDNVIFPENTTYEPGKEPQKYFEITLIRNNTLSPSGQTLADVGFLAFTIRLRWPAYVTAGTELQEFTQHTQKSVLLVPASVHR
jgi:type II secretory pathway pseudopilin PulG